MNALLWRLSRMVTLSLAAVLTLTTLSTALAPEAAHASPVRCKDDPGERETSTAGGEVGVPAWAQGWGEEWDWSEVDPAEFVGGVDAVQVSDYEIQCGVGLRAFTRKNFRHNLRIVTGRAPAGHDAHHALPVKHEPWFKSRGINIHDPKYGAWWSSTPHKSNAYAWNKEWARFIRDNHKASVAEIHRQGREMLKSEGLRVAF